MKAVARLKTLCTGLDGHGVLCLEVGLCAVSLLGFAELRKRGGKQAHGGISVLPGTAWVECR